MLVCGWTIYGTLSSSYDYTMGFGVSARVDKDRDILPPSKRLSSLLSSKLFSLSARRSLALYDFYRRLTTSQKSDKATRIALKSTGAWLILCSTPPHFYSVKSNTYSDCLAIPNPIIFGVEGGCYG